MLGLGTSLASIDSGQIYKEADEFANAADLDVWFDFGLLTGAQDSEVGAATNLGNLGTGGGSRSFTDATCDYNNGTAIAMDSTAGIAVSMEVAGTGIPEGAYVEEITSATEFLLSASTSGGAVTNGTLTFTSTATSYNITSNVDAPTLDYVLMPRASVKFDGTSEEALALTSTYTTTGKAYTWFIVLYRPDDTNDAIIANAVDGAEYFALRGSGGSIRIAKADMSSVRTVAFNTTGGSTVDYTYQDASDAGSNGIQILIYNRNSSGVIKIYNHLGQYIATNSNAHVKEAANMTVGSLGGTSSSSLADFNGNIGEFGIYDEDITAANCIELAKNLAIKWGAALV